MLVKTSNEIFTLAKFAGFLRVCSWTIKWHVGNNWRKYLPSDSEKVTASVCHKLFWTTPGSRRALMRFGIKASLERKRDADGA